MRRVLEHCLLMLLPWGMRRRLLQRLYGYEIHPSARIGLSVVAPGHLRMGPGTVIESFNMIRGMDLVEMGPGAGISKLNWIYGMPTTATQYYAHESDRRSELVLAEGGGLLNRHLIDCTNSVRIGRYSLLVGYGTQVITHAIDHATGRQSSQPVEIGDFCMVGTRCLLLGGASLPSHSALGAGSMLRDRPERPYGIYSGVPAKHVGDIDPGSGYFRAETHDAHARIRAAGVAPPPPR